MKFIKECKTVESGLKQNFSATEKGKTFILSSNKNFICDVISIDKCVFGDSNLRRCDYLLLVLEKKIHSEVLKPMKAFYVELKGDDVRSACEQLYNAIYITKGEILNCELVAKVIGTKGFQPNIRNNDYYRKVKKMIGREIDFHIVHKGNGYKHIEVI